VPVFSTLPVGQDDFWHADKVARMPEVFEGRPDVDLPMPNRRIAFEARSRHPTAAFVLVFARTGSCLASHRVGISAGAAVRAPRGNSGPAAATVRALYALKRLAKAESATLKIPCRCSLSR
jgi:hypothetical protein